MAIEANQLTEKDELIGKFYTVRAGLSVIADENQKIKHSIYWTDQLKKINERRNKNSQNKYDDDMSGFNSQKINLENNIEQESKNLNSANNSLAYKTRLKKENKEKNFAGYAVKEFFTGKEKIQENYKLTNFLFYFGSIVMGFSIAGTIILALLFFFELLDVPYFLISGGSLILGIVLAFKSVEIAKKALGFRSHSKRYRLL